MRWSLVTGVHTCALPICFRVGLEHREVDDPAHFEFVGIDQIELFGDARARQPGKLHRDGFLARGEEQAVVGAEAEFGGKRVHLFRPMVLGDRAAPLATLRSEEQTYELQSLMRTSYAVFGLKKKKQMI